MRTFLCLATLWVGLSQPASSQELGRSKGQGYFFVAPGLGNIPPSNANIHIGGGGEWLLRKGFGMGLEIGALGPLGKGPERMPFRWTDNVRGLGSANFSYHFLPSTTDQKLEPFVTAGYSTFFRAGISNGYNAGAGVNIWVKNKTALRFEIRDHQSYNRDTLSFRAGMTFR